MRADSSGHACIRIATSADVSALARLYAEALPGDVCARLGGNYLVGTFFPALLGSDMTHVVLAEQSGEAVGFCVMAIDSATVNGLLKRLPVAAAVAAMASAWRDPRLLYDLYCSLFRVKRALDPGLTIGGVPEVYLIGVRPNAQGTGIGRRLLAAGLAGVAGTANGDISCVAKTSAARAAEFYRRQGFAQIGTEWRGPRAFQVLIYRATGMAERPLRPA